MNPGRALIALALIGAAAATRYVHLDYDPPDWVEAVYFVDEGWWGESARAKVFFDDFFAGEFGRFYLLNPAYTLVLTAIYSVTEVSLLVTRVLAATSNQAVILLLGIFLWKKMDVKTAFTGAALLLLSPFFWAYGRLALPESFQGFFVLLAFVLWHGSTGKGAAFGSGICIAVAAAVKPNAVVFGFIPLLVSVGLVEFSKAKVGTTSQSGNFLKRFGAAAAGCFLVSVLITAFILLPHWDLFLTSVLTIHSEAEGGWQTAITLPGRAIVSKVPHGGEHIPILWRLIHYSPVILLGFWLSLVHLSNREEKAAPRQSDLMLIASVSFSVSSWLLISSSSVSSDSRYISVLPTIAISAAIILAHPGEFALSPRRAQGEALGRLARTLVIFLPLVFISTPPLARLVMRYVPDGGMGAQPGLGFGSATTLLLIGWLIVIFIFSAAGKAPALMGRALNLNLIRSLTILLLLYEGATLLRSAARQERTIAEARIEFQRMVPPGETVAGYQSTQFFYSKPVHAVRRISAGTPYIDIDDPSWEEINPRFAIEKKVLNYVPFREYARIETNLLSRGYEVVRSIEMGPKRAGKRQLEVVLFERKSDAAD